jgi:hypothetical protein
VITLLLYRAIGHALIIPKQRVVEVEEQHLEERHVIRSLVCDAGQALCAYELEAGALFTDDHRAVSAVADATGDHPHSRSRVAQRPATASTSVWVRQRSDNSISSSMSTRSSQAWGTQRSAQRALCVSRSRVQSVPTSTRSPTGPRSREASPDLMCVPPPDDRAVRVCQRCKQEVAEGSTTAER